VFRIGDFSKIAQVSGRLLRYYDRIGLFSPERIDGQTGYRYYEAAQLPRLNRILALKGLGLSLDQVARLLDDGIGAEEIRAMLDMRRSQLERNVRSETERLRFVESRIRQLESEGHILGQDVLLKSLAPQPYLSRRETFKDLRELRECVIGIHVSATQRIGEPNLGPIVVVVHSPSFEVENLDCEVGFVLRGGIDDRSILPGELALVEGMLPGIPDMATTIHSGDLEQRHVAYGFLGNWIEANGFRMSGAGREVLLQLPLPDRSDEAVVEIQLPVVRE